MRTQKKASSRREWLVVAGLLLLSAVPIAAGAFRLTMLSSGGPVTPENARFFASPIPVVAHIISVTIYALLGAFQFAPTLRRRNHRWHRLSGYLLIPSGFVAALTGLWMAHFYPWPEGDGQLLYALRLLFGTLMLVALVLATLAIRQRRFVVHGEWMLRAYAIGLGAGTQVFTHLPWVITGTVPTEFGRAMAMGAGWVINLAVAEWVIRRKRGQRSRPRRSTSSLSV